MTAWENKTNINLSTENLEKKSKSKFGSIKEYFSNRIANIINKNNNLNNILNEAKKNWALVEELEAWKYQITQKQKMLHGKLMDVDYNSDDFYVKVVSRYDEKSLEPKPTDEIKYYHNIMWWDNPVVKRKVRDEDGIKYYILDRWTKLGVEFSWYDETWNKIPNKEQSVRILWEDNRTIQIYKWEDIENALLVPNTNESDRYSNNLLDISTVLGDNSITRRIVDWQANDWTKYLIQAWQRFKPENFVKTEELDDSEEYVEFYTQTPAFKGKLEDYNEFAKSKNLKIEESTEKWRQVLKFKNLENQVVREIIVESKKTEIKFDTFFQLTKDWDIYQSATRDKNGNIISRTINEFRPWWWKASTVTLDYENKKATSWLYLKWKLTDIKNIDLESWEYMFRDIAGRNMKN